MAEERHIYRHEDGREISLTDAGYKEFYGASSGFAKVRPETEGDFLVEGVPKPKRVRKPPRAKAAAPVVETASEGTEG